MDVSRLLEDVARTSRETFARKMGVLALAEYVDLLVQRPYALTRSVAQVLRDLFDAHGHYEVTGVGGKKLRRFRLFDAPERDGLDAVFGHEDVQARLYEILSEFAERGRIDKFILLHGPSGSAKSSLVNCLIGALEDYSRTEAGAMFRFSWIFCEAGDKGSLGFQSGARLEERDSLAHVDEKLISSRIPCEMKDPPFLLLPKRKRREILEAALAEAPEEERVRFRWTDSITSGELSPKNRAIYECLLKAYGGDWGRVIRHIRVERYYVSQRYRTAAVTIEPQGTIDASSRLLSHSSLSGIPPVVAHESLVEANGDLVEANGGIVDYSDFLKRNMEANKYLLTTVERGFLNLPGLTVPIDLLFFGSTDEKYLSAFKRDPTFPSFKGRFELIRVPYLREYRKEAAIYRRHLGRVAQRLDVAPHLAEVAALWAVLTRLQRPVASHFESREMGRLASGLAPLDKAFLLDAGVLPETFDDESRKVMRTGLSALLEEFDAREEEFEGFLDAGYEGRRGASAREVLTLLSELAVQCGERSLSPVAFLGAVSRMTADKSIYSYLRVPADHGYHDPERFLDAARKFYIRSLADEIRRAASLVSDQEYHRIFRDYLSNVRAFETREKVVNRATGKAEDPDAKAMAEVERHLVAAGHEREFRRSLIAKAASWKMSNPERELDIDDLFRDVQLRLQQGYFREQIGRIVGLVEDALVVRAGAGSDLARERRVAAEGLIARLLADFGYVDNSLTEMLAHFVRHHSDLSS